MMRRRYSLLVSMAIAAIMVMASGLALACGPEGVTYESSKVKTYGSQAYDSTSGRHSSEGELVAEAAPSKTETEISRSESRINVQSSETTMPEGSTGEMLSSQKLIIGEPAEMTYSTKVRDTIQSYVQSHMTEGSFQLTDEKLGKPARLTLNRVHTEELRKIGEGRYVARAEFHSAEGEKYYVDFILTGMTPETLTVADSFIYSVGNEIRYTWRKEGMEWTREPFGSGLAARRLSSEESGNFTSSEPMAPMVSEPIGEPLGDALASVPVRDEAIPSETVVIRKIETYVRDHELDKASLKHPFEATETIRLRTEGLKVENVTPLSEGRYLARTSFLSPDGKIITLNFLMEGKGEENLKVQDIFIHQPEGAERLCYRFVGGDWETVSMENSLHRQACI